MHLLCPSLGVFYCTFGNVSFFGSFHTVVLLSLISIMTVKVSFMQVFDDRFQAESGCILSVCLSVCLSICLSLYLSICLSVCLSVDRSVGLSVSVCLCLSVCVCLSVCLSIYLSVYLSVCLSVCLSICLSIYLSIYLSVYLSICLSIYLSVSVCLSVRPSTYLPTNLSIYLYINLLHAAEPFLLNFLHSSWCSINVCPVLSSLKTITKPNKKCVYVLTPLYIKSPFKTPAFQVVPGNLEASRHLIVRCGPLSQNAYISES